MTITLNGTTGITTPAITDVSTGNVAYTGTLTGGTGVFNLGSGQLVKDTSGNLGLGVTPSAWGTNYKAMQLGSSGNVAGITITGNDASLGSNYFLNSSNAATYVANGASTYLSLFNGQYRFFTAPSGTAGAAIAFTQAMTLDASGNLLVGTTTVAGGTAATFTVGGIFQRNAAAPAGRYRQSFGDASNNYIVYNQSNIGMYMTDGGTTWQANSDERLKTTLTPFANAVEKVCTLRSGTGRYLTDEATVSRSFLIAQDVLKVLPEAVNVQADEMGTLGLAYTDLIPLLTAAIQEQQALIVTQQAALDSLTTRLTALENN